MSNVQNESKTGWVSVALLLCVGAAASVSVTTSLLMIALVAFTVCLLQLVNKILAPLTPRGVHASTLVLAATLAAIYHMALAAWMPEWLHSLPSLPVFYWTILLCAPLAVDFQRGKSVSPLMVWLTAAAWLLTGAVREFLSLGKLAGVRVIAEDTSFLSRDFALGAAGVIVAGLILAVFGLRHREVCDYSMRESWIAACCLTILAALSGWVVVIIKSLVTVTPIFYLPIAALTVGILSAVGCAAISSKVIKRGFEDPLIITLSTILAYQAVQQTEKNMMAVYPLVNAVVWGVLFAVVVSLVIKMRTLKLPKPFYSTPALLIGAGLVLYALSVL